MHREHGKSIGDVMEVGRHLLSQYQAVPLELIPATQELPEREFFTFEILRDLPITESDHEV